MDSLPQELFDNVLSYRTKGYQKALVEAYRSIYYNLLDEIEQREAGLFGESDIVKEANIAAAKNVISFIKLEVRSLIGR